MDESSHMRKLMSLATIHSNSKCLNTSSLKMIHGGLRGTFPNMRTIVCCEGVGSVPVGAIRANPVLDESEMLYRILRRGDSKRRGSQGFVPKHSISAL
jgi:hypothetical protein